MRTTGLVGEKSGGRKTDGEVTKRAWRLRAWTEAESESSSLGAGVLLVAARVPAMGGVLARCILLDLDRDQRTAEVRPSREATSIARWALARVNREAVDRGVVGAKSEEE
jgi:hypothetical protein